MNRREFLETVAAAAVSRRSAARTPQTNGARPFSTCTSIFVRSRPPTSRISTAPASRKPISSRAGRALDQVKALQAAAPGRFTWFSSYDVTQPDAEQVLTQAVKSGAQGFGEMKFHVAADGPELRRMYALAADLHVPILIHFQEVDHIAERRNLEPPGLRKRSSRSSRPIRRRRSSGMRMRSGPTSARTIAMKPSTRPARSSVAV